MTSSDRPSIVAASVACGIAPVRRQLTSHGLLDLGPLLVGHPPAIDQQVGQRQGRLADPVCTCLRQMVGVDRPALKSNHAKEEITFGVHGSFTFPATRVESVHRS